MSNASHLHEKKIEAILDALANAPAHIVPEQVLEAAHDHQESLIPHLQQAVAQAHALSASGRLQAEGDWRLPCFALQLLAAWRVPGAYDLILKSLMLDDRYDSRWLMGDAYIEWPHLLITTFDGDVDRLFCIAGKVNPPWNSDLRTCCVLVLAAAYHHRLGDRATIQAGFDQMLDFCQDHMLLGTVLLCIARLRMAPLLPKLSQIMKTERGKRGISQMDIDSELESSWEESFDDSSICPNPILQPRQDLLTIIRGWQYFQPPFRPSTEHRQSFWYQHEKRVHDDTGRPGSFILYKRTLPCRCGSGLPYGACCINK